MKWLESLRTKPIIVIALLLRLLEVNDGGCLSMIFGQTVGSGKKKIKTNLNMEILVVDGRNLIAK